ncbi:MAG: winged helix-turn-helix transcriptional regulator [Chloroflexi bacterium]|nr:winged helix-turn-helix transcriptional regulator [Chloroflexota bacterium]
MAGASDQAVSIDALDSLRAGVVARVLRTLADPTRLQLVQAMTLDCCSVSHLVRESSLSQPLVSHHLRILRDAGLVRAERRGAFVFYCLRDLMVWQIIKQCLELVERLRLVDNLTTLPEPGEGA